jgi:HEAT repeat protein
MAADPDTVATARSEVTERDIPVLIDLLDDPRDQVRYGASGVLVRIGEPAVPPLNALQTRARE